MQDANAVRRIVDFHHWIDGTEWEYLDQARGDVVIPDGKRLMLAIDTAQAWRDLSLLASLPSDAFYELGLSGSESGGPKPGDSCTAYISTLSGLYIKENRITDAGLVHLAQIETLDYLMLPARITETGLHHLRGLKGLKSLWVSGSGGSVVGDKGLADLVSLQSLEELLICGNAITDAGADELVKLGHLKKLTLTASPRLTDAGLKKLTALKGLECLNLDRASISISGLSFLNTLPRLSRLDVRGIRQDDSGLDISGLTRLEDLSLQLKRGPGAQRAVLLPWREQDIAGLGGLTRLKRLQISHGGATDTALSHLTGLKRLERLSIGGDVVTDDGLAHLEALPNLSSLTLSGNFTDGALSHLQKLQNLSLLDFSRGPVQPGRGRPIQAEHAAAHVLSRLRVEPGSPPGSAEATSKEVTTRTASVFSCTEH